MTLLLGQTGNDTIKCYNASELRLIASGLVKGKECQNNMVLCEKEVQILNNVIEIQSVIISNDSLIIESKDEQLRQSESKIKGLTNDLKIETRKHKWTKIKYGITTTLFIAFTTWLVVK